MSTIAVSYDFQVSATTKRSVTFTRSGTSESRFDIDSGAEVIFPQIAAGTMQYFYDFEIEKKDRDGYTLSDISISISNIRGL